MGATFTKFGSIANTKSTGRMGGACPLAPLFCVVLSLFSSFIEFSSLNCYSHSPQGLLLCLAMFSVLFPIFLTDNLSTHTFTLLAPGSRKGIVVCNS